MSGKKLGKGLDALISVDVKSESVASDKAITDKSTSDKLKSGKLKASQDVFVKAVEDGKKNPRVVVWSPKSSIVLRVLKKSIPEFSISKEASLLLEEAIKRKYPEIWKEVDRYLEK